jgi:zona occludens toxin
MIEVLQGALGSGKSAVGTARGLDHVRAGGVVAANFSLVDGWSDVVSGQNIRAKFDKDYKHKRSASMYNRFFRVDSLAALRKIPVKELAEGKHKTHGGYQEGQGLLILDECQLVFNSRKWEKNMDWIQFFTQSRKLGWNVLLIAHTIEMIDSQIRPLAEYESRFRNLNKVKLPLLGLPLSPVPFFLVVQRYAGLGAGSSVIAGRTGYPLPLWAARLYDSLEVFNADDWGKNTEPVLCGNAPAPPSGVRALPSPTCVRFSSLHGCHWDDYLQTVQLMPASEG